MCRAPGSHARRVPLDWAMTQAIWASCSRRSANGRAARETYRPVKAHRARSRKRRASGCRSTGPRLRATRCCSRALGEREGDTEQAAGRVRAYEGARGKTRERVPLDWAVTQNNLGAAPWPSGSGKSGTESLNRPLSRPIVRHSRKPHANGARSTGPPSKTISARCP